GLPGGIFTHASRVKEPEPGSRFGLSLTRTFALVPLKRKAWPDFPAAYVTPPPSIPPFAPTASPASPSPFHQLTRPCVLMAQPPPETFPTASSASTSIRCDPAVNPVTVAVSVAANGLHAPLSTRQAD